MPVEDIILVLVEDQMPFAKLLHPSESLDQQIKSRQSNIDCPADAASV